MPTDRQLDLFDAAGLTIVPLRPAAVRPSLSVGGFDDGDLIAAIPLASQEDCHALAGEVAHRGLGGAVPALEALCRRFRGFGLTRTVPEQTAALQGLARLGGVEAAAAVARIIEGDVVQGPALTEALHAAAALHCRLPAECCLALLRHPDPTVRAAAAALTRARADCGDSVTAVLIDLLLDLNKTVARAAAIALGRAGRTEGRLVLARVLWDDPSAEVIEAAASVADEQMIVLLGRIARSRPDLIAAASAALEDIDDPRATKLGVGLRQNLSG
jgi:hypothetical protein